MLAKIQSLAESFSESVMNIILSAPLSELALQDTKRQKTPRLHPDVIKAVNLVEAEDKAELPKRRKVVRKKLANKTSKVKAQPLALIHVELEK